MPPILVFLLFQIPFIMWIFILSLRYHHSLIYFLPHSLSCRAHPPTDWYIAGCLEAGVRAVLCRVRSEYTQLLYFGILVFVNDTCGSWDRPLILYMHIYGEPCSSFISCWHSRYLVLGCSNKKCIYQHDTMYSWKLSFLRLYGLIERNSRIHIDMFLHK